MKVSIYGYIADMDKKTMIRKNFSLEELANNKGVSTIPQFVIDKRADTFLDMLQEFRDWYNKPMTVNSCYRQEAYNRKVGGDKNSAHQYSCALDWGVKNHTNAQRENVRKKWSEICTKHKVIGSINFYTNGYHLEAYSNVWYGQKVFNLRDYRKTSHDW